VAGDPQSRMTRAGNRLRLILLNLDFCCWLATEGRRLDYNPTRPYLPADQLSHGKT